MLNFSFRKKSTDKKIQDTQNDQKSVVKNEAPIQVTKVEEDIFALAAKEEEERNLNNVAAAGTITSNSTLETSIAADVKEVENKLPEQLSQNPAPEIPEAINHTPEKQTPEQPILADRQMVEIEAAKPIEDANSANIPVNISEEVSIQNNQANQSNIKVEEVTDDNKKFIHPNDQDPAIWVPQLIEILREMAQEETPSK